MDKPIGMMVHDARLKLGLTQIGLAEALGVDSMTVSRWERGECEPLSLRMLELSLRQLAIEREVLV